MDWIGRNQIGKRVGAVLVIILVGNILTGISKEAQPVYYALHTVPFGILSIVAWFSKVELNRTLLTICLIIISCLCILTMGGGDLTAAIFFCFALHLTREQKKRIFCIVAIVLSIAVKFAVLHAQASQLITFLAGFLFVYFFYDYYIAPTTKEVVLNYLKLPIDKDVIDIMSLRVHGLSWSEINKVLQLNISDAHLRRKINNELHRQGLKNKEELVFLMHEKGVMRTVRDERRIRSA